MTNVVIVGASSGIGYALAEALARGGVKVGVAARRTARLEQLKNRYPANVEVECIDITAIDAPTHLNALIHRLGGMDIYVHAAGIGYENATLDIAREVEIIGTDATGFARMLAAAYRYFKHTGIPGSIAAISSVAGTRGIGRMAAYSASKAFDYAYIDALEQLAVMDKLDIKFTDIRPGWIRTPLLNDKEKYIMEMSMEHALPLILKAIVRRQRVAYVDARWRTAAAAMKAVPRSVWKRLKL